MRRGRKGPTQKQIRPPGAGRGTRQLYRREQQQLEGEKIGRMRCSCLNVEQNDPRERDRQSHRTSLQRIQKLTHQAANNAETDNRQAKARELHREIGRAPNRVEQTTQHDKQRVAGG